MLPHSSFWYIIKASPSCLFLNYFLTCTANWCWICIGTSLLPPTASRQDITTWQPHASEGRTGQIVECAHCGCRCCASGDKVVLMTVYSHIIPGKLMVDGFKKLCWTGDIADFDLFILIADTAFCNSDVSVCHVSEDTLKILNLIMVCRLCPWMFSSVVSKHTTILWHMKQKTLLKLFLQ